LSTPLMTAASKGWVEVVEYLIRKNVIVDHVNKNRDTALSLAVDKNKTLTAIRLIEAGANVYHIDGDGDSLLTLACRNGNAEIVQILLANQQLDINHKSGNKKWGHEGWTALHIAASKIKPGIVKALLEAGADFYLRTPEPEWKMAYDLAAKVVTQEDQEQQAKEQAKEDCLDYLLAAEKGTEQGGILETAHSGIHGVVRQVGQLVNGELQIYIQELCKLVKSQQDNLNRQQEEIRLLKGNK